jgi:glycosyltransferase involved in cell wall biosynthesis
MKVVIATPLYPPEIGGPATYVKLLHGHLPRHGIEVDIVKFSDTRGSKGIRHVVFAWKVFRASRGADVLFALDLLSVGWPTLCANVLRRKKFIVKMVGDHVWEQGKQRFGIKGDLDHLPTFSASWHPYLAFLRMLQLVVARWADRIVVPSEYLSKVVQSWGIPKEKICIIYNGIALPQALSVPSKKEGEFLIVSSGRRVPWKGFEAIEEVAAREPGWRVQIASGLPREEVLSLVKSAEVFVLNSRYEGLSHALIEAMTLGTPVIATDAGGNAELVTPETGILIPVGDAEALYAAIKQIQDQPQEARERSKRAQERMQDFTVPRMIDATVELIARV